MSGFKFMVGVAMSMAVGLSFWEQFLITTTGGIAGVWFFTYLGDRIRQWINARRRSPPKNPSLSRWHLLWAKYGLWGVAILTPPILSPPIGTALALAFGSPRHAIAWRMTIAMIGWGFFFAFAWARIRSWLHL